MERVQFGVDAACATPGLLKGNLGLVTNDAARTAGDARLTTRAALLKAGVRITRLFSPEHGMKGNEADGARVPDAHDALTGLPVISLYGEKLRPLQEDLAGLDAVVFDLPDIGSRFYTYIWTLHEMLEVCVNARKRLVLLDRPNPLGGEPGAAEGPMLDTAQCGSFLGRARIPIRHSLTAGEMLRMWHGERLTGGDIEVVPCRNWTRSMHWPDLRLDFVPTSPAMTSYVSALLYPGTCLFEATNLSVGRGTPHPFQAVGAPWLDASTTAMQFNALNLPGVTAERCHFCPTQGPWTNQDCQAVKLRVVNPRAIRPVSAGLLLLALTMRAHPHEFSWADYPTAANPTGRGHFELLVGQRGLREKLARTLEIPELVPEWTRTTGWWERAAAVLLYPDQVDLGR